MPENNFSLKTEVGYEAGNVLILDDRGEIATVLTDNLLSRGFSVYYLGKESRETFHYLQDKNNFHWLSSAGELASLPEIIYVFGFPQKDFLSKEAFSWLRENPGRKVLLCFSQEVSEVMDWQTLLKESLNLRLVVFGQVFGPRIKSGLLGNLFSLCVKDKAIHLPAEAEKEIYSISADKLAAEIMRLTFSSDTQGRAFFLQTEPLKLGLFVEHLKKILPEAEFHFVGSESLSGQAGGGMERIELSENWQEKIEETLAWFQRNSVPVIQPEPEVKEEIFQETSQPVVATVDFIFSSDKKEETIKPVVEPRKKRLWLGLVFFLLLAFCFFCLPALLLGGAGWLGLKELNKAEQGLEAGNFSSALQSTQHAQGFFELSQKVLLLSGPFYSVIGLGEPVEEANDILQLGQYLESCFHLSLQAIQEGVVLTNHFVNGETPEWTENLSMIKANLSLAYEQASLAQSSLSRTEKTFHFLRKESFWERLNQNLPKNRELLLNSQNLITVFPQILGLPGRKTYLLLLQNNMELRPTGGFIGSYGVISLENGRLNNFEVFDVYQADGQLKGHVEPPADLKAFLGEATWYLRDSNWDPKFAVSAQRAQWFLDKEMQVAVDGTIAINLETVKGLLTVFGEVDLPEYQEKINSANLFEKAEYYSELGTFPGSTQKKDFLGSLAKALFEKVKKAKNKDLVNLGGQLLNLLEQKEVLLYFDDPQAEAVVTQLNWAGDLGGYQPGEEQGSVVADYLFLNEANVGIDKANFFVKRKVDQKVTVSSEGQIQGKLTLTYENQSPSESWPAGRYKTYLRFYLPKGARVTSVLATDSKNPDLWSPVENQQISLEEAYEKMVGGILFEVPIKSQRKLEISYQLPNIFDLSKKLNTYLLMVQKQSGAYPSPYTLTFEYPPNFVPLRVIPSAAVGEGKLLVTAKLNKDLIFQIDLAH